MKQTKLNAAICLTLFANMSLAGQMLKYDVNNPALIGQGWNSQKNKPITGASCLIFKVKEGKSATTTGSVVDTRDAYTMTRSSNLDLNLNLDTLFTKSSVHLKNITSHVHSSDFKTLLVKINIDIEPDLIVPYKQDPQLNSAIKSTNGNIQVNDLYSNSSLSLKPEYKELAKKNPQEFNRRCGDSFVAAIYKGGVFNGYITEKIEHLDQSRNTVINADIKGQKLNIDDLYKYVSDKTGMSMNFLEIGGFQRKGFVNREGFLNELETFPASVMENPYSLNLSVVRYDQLPDWGEMKQMVRSVTSVDYLIKAYWKLINLQAEIIEIQENPDDWFMFLDTKKSNLNLTLHEVNQKLSELSDIAKVCSTNPICEIGTWKTFSDFEYRKQLPAPIKVIDFLNKDLSQFKESLKKIIEAREIYWIEDAERSRIKYLGEGELHPKQFLNIQQEQFLKMIENM